MGCQDEDGKENQKKNIANLEGKRKNMGIRYPENRGSFWCRLSFDQIDYCKYEVSLVINSKSRI